jgi:hypothetical protein
VRPGRLGDLLLADPLLAALEERWPDAAIELVTDASDRVPPWMLRGRVVQRTLALRRGPDAWLRPGDAARSAALAGLARAWGHARPRRPALRRRSGRPGAARGGGGDLGPGAVGPGAPDWAADAQPTPRCTPSWPPHPRSMKARGCSARRAAGADARFRLPASRPRRRRSRPGTGPPWSCIRGVALDQTLAPERWGELAARLAAAGARTVVVGDATDRAHVPGLGVAFDERALLDRVGALDLAGLASVVASADAFAGNDSFPFHLAAAAGVPALALVGPGALRWSAYPADHVTVVREPVVCSPRYGEECPVYTTCRTARACRASAWTPSSRGS